MSKRLMLLSVICMSSAVWGCAYSQTVIKATINFHTTSDDKDGDSQVRDHIVCNGQVYLKLECCSAGRHSSADHWGNNSNQSRDMTIVSPLQKSMLPSCQFVAGLTAVGNDNWPAIYSLDLTFSDGSKASFAFGEIDLNSRNSALVEVTKPIR